MLIWLAGIAGTLALLAVGALIAARFAFDPGGLPANAVLGSVRSGDGSVIAYEKTGAGPTVIVVAAALADRSGARRVATHLARNYTVINYDRRGRGDSTDTQPYSIGREVEDIEALAAGAGEPVFLFGSSSGAVLALDAANTLGAKVRGAFLYEPPLIVDESHAPVPETLAADIDRLVSAGRRDDAVKLFFTGGMGIPNGAANAMSLLMPGWSKMTRMAHTIRYDLTVLAGTQSGHPAPAGRWSGITAPVMVSVGSRSEPFFHAGARSLARIVPGCRYETLEGRDHSAILFAADALAGAARSFFAAIGESRSTAVR